jgi:hypothetical protein
MIRRAEGRVEPFHQVDPWCRPATFEPPNIRLGDVGLTSKFCLGHATTAAQFPLAGRKTLDDFGVVDRLLPFEHDFPRGFFARFRGPPTLTVRMIDSYFGTGKLTLAVPLEAI